ncbi:MAG: O-antigen ligase family protein [Oceanospirillaceae bacterium]|nr:O-antigen ligase family protein [Oceanospirillaceae bacterium]
MSNAFKTGAERFMAPLLIAFFILQPFGRTYWLPLVVLLVIGLIKLVSTRDTLKHGQKQTLFWVATAGLCFFAPAAFSLFTSIDVPRTAKFVATYPLYVLIGAVISMHLNPKSGFVNALALVVAAWSITVAIQFADPSWNPFGGREVYNQGVFSHSFSGSLMLGIICTPILPFLVYSYIHQGRYKLAATLFVLISSLCFLSGNRAALLSPLLTLFSLFVWIFYVKKTRLSYLTLPLVGGAVFVFVGYALMSYNGGLVKYESIIAALKTMDYEQLDLALSGRLSIWYDAFNVGLIHPLTGVGADNFRYAHPMVVDGPSLFISDTQGDAKFPQQGASHAHQFFFDAWAGTGLVGLIGLVAFYMLLAGLTLRTLKHSDASAFGLIVAVWAVVFPFNTHNNFFGSWMNAWMWIWIGLMLSQIAVGRSTREDVS